MSLALLRILEHIHGHLGWLGVAALLHPAILLRNPKRRARLSVVLATALVVLTGVMGATIYPDYRTHLKQAIFLDAPALGWCFERKEHLAVGALGFALVGCIAHLGLRRFKDETQTMLAKSAHLAFVVSFALASLAAGLGVAVASYSTF